MPHRLFGVLMLLLVSIVGWAQGEVVLMRIDGSDVTKAEFEYYFQHSDMKKSVDFLPRFVDRRLKLLYAKELGLDTLQVYRMQVLHHRYKRLGEEKETKGMYIPLRERSEWIQVTSITRRLSQRGSFSIEKEEKALMDSLYAVLQGGADMETLSLQYSMGKYRGKPVWMPELLLLQEWRNVLAVLQKGEVSRPFYSPEGIHILRWTEKDDRKGKQEKQKSKPLTEWEWKEIQESLLIKMVDERYGVSSITYSKDDLKVYFERHKKEYSWEFPHYRGAVIHCRDKKQAKVIKRYLKQYPFEEWETAFSRMTGNLSDAPRIETGIFQIGRNAYVDKLVFKCGTFEPLVELPYTFVMGKKLKKGPESYLDVLDEVKKDWLDTYQNEWIEPLREKYKVEINEDVLKTVNNNASY